MLLEDLCLPRPSRVGESEERNNHCHLEEMDEQDFEKFVKAATQKLVDGSSLMALENA